MKFIVSEKKGVNGILLVVTDLEIFGKKFEENNLQLDLSKNFYHGEEKKENEVKEIIITAKHFHFTGRAAVALALNLGLIRAKNILYIQGVPHAEAVIED